VITTPLLTPNQFHALTPARKAAVTEWIEQYDVALDDVVEICIDGDGATYLAIVDHRRRAIPDGSELVVHYVKVDIPEGLL